VKLLARSLAALAVSVPLAIGTAPLATADTTPDSGPTAADVRAAGAASNAAAERVGIEPTGVHAAVARAINPGDYECAPTGLDAFVDDLVNGMSDEEFFFLVTHLELLDIPTYDALLYGTKGDSGYAIRSDYRTLLTNTFRDVKKFWDVESDDIQLMAMHGGWMTDEARVARILKVDEIFGLTDAEAEAKAAEIADAISSGMFDGGNNALFTLNAYAFTAEGDPDPLVQGLPDKLVFGDGILDALDYLGIGNVGSRAVMGHEFGHHVQYEDNLFDSPLTGPEATRRTELMADAFGTYFATHARGLSINDKRVLQAERTSFEVGDCQFASPGHHGTPNQRMRAATWAADLANAARPQGKILPSLTFAEKFDQKLPEIVAPDKK
jgi:hypothetical protein